MKALQIPIISDPLILEAVAPARHWVTVRYPSGNVETIETWSIDESAVAVFGLLEQARSSLGEFEFVQLRKVSEAV